MKKKHQRQSERSLYFLTVQRASANLDILLTRFMEDVFYDCSPELDEYHRNLLLSLVPLCDAINEILCFCKPPKRE